MLVCHISGPASVLRIETRVACVAPAGSQLSLIFSLAFCLLLPIFSAYILFYFSLGFVCVFRLAALGGFIYQAPGLDCLKHCLSLAMLG